ncbi:MAG: hypothetical protein U0324_40945 [Polyangiales bacterium]
MQRTSLRGVFLSAMLLAAAVGCRRRAPQADAPPATQRPSPAPAPMPAPAPSSGPPQVAATEALSWAPTRAAALTAIDASLAQSPAGAVSDLDGDGAPEELLRVEGEGCVIVRARPWGFGAERLDAQNAHTGHACELVARPGATALLLVQGDGHEANTDETPVTSNTWRAMTLWRPRPDRRAEAVFDDREEEDGPRSGHAWAFRALDAAHVVQSRSYQRGGAAVTDQRVLRQGAQGYEAASCYVGAAWSSAPGAPRCTVTLRNDVHLRDSEVAASEGPAAGRGSAVEVLHAASLRRGETRMYCLRQGSTVGLAFLTEEEAAGCPTAP